VQSHLTIENQLYPLFKRLFEFLADFYQRPVFFFTDDLQWIDASGINLLKYLLLNLSNQKLVWIGACRAPQNKISLVGQLVEELRLKELKVENVFLKGLSNEEVSLFVEMTLGARCHHDLIDTCHTLTEGNPSHLQALLESLKNSELLWLEDNIFHGDAGAVKAQYEGQKAQSMFMEYVKKLSSPAYDVLCIMACMGRFNRQIILEWLQGDKVRMNLLLNEAWMQACSKLTSMRFGFLKYM
jgi:predicted ATPase